METKSLKEDRNYIWTLHSKYKMFQYNLSPGLVKRITRFADRTEEGIAPDTVAVMRRKDTEKQKREIWVMWQKFGRKKKIISAWIYPGVTPKGKQIYIPDDTLEELYKENALVKEKFVKEKSEKSRLDS